MKRVLFISDRTIRVNDRDDIDIDGVSSGSTHLIMVNGKIQLSTVFHDMETIIIPRRIILILRKLKPSN